MFIRSAPFTGRLNLYAAATGVVEIDAAAVAAINAVDEAVTLATLPDRARVAARQMVATVKIIPYAAPEASVARIEALLAAREYPVLRLHGLAAVHHAVEGQPLLLELPPRGSKPPL